MWPSSEKEELAFNPGVDEEEFPKRPIAVVNPVQSPRRKTEEAEVSVRQTCSHNLVSRTVRETGPGNVATLFPRVSFVTSLSEFLLLTEEGS